MQDTQPGHPPTHPHTPCLKRRVQGGLRWRRDVPDAQLAVSAARREQVGAEAVELQALHLVACGRACVRALVVVMSAGHASALAPGVGVWPANHHHVLGFMTGTLRTAAAAMQIAFTAHPLPTHSLTPPLCFCILDSSGLAPEPSIRGAGFHRQMLPSARPPPMMPYCGRHTQGGNRHTRCTCVRSWISGAWQLVAHAHAKQPCRLPAPSPADRLPLTAEGSMPAFGSALARPHCLE
jgi:hypothetical protein